ncbi:MAG TPA: ion channel [Chitinophagaceae bacterium]|nr:ion channel [Chitinophagaceae bacterium]
MTTGFGTSSEYNAGRFYNRSGRVNILKKGVNIFNRYSWYHTMLAMPRIKFLILIFSIYILINLVFACIYYLIGIEHLAGVNSGSAMKNFSEVFFFSTQTFTTVGYGRISPTGFLASSIATLEAFLGLLSFAIATGLFYGRFSRPQAFLKFSHHALISPFKESIAMMFRMSPFKNNTLSEAEVKLTAAMQIEENGKRMNKFYPLEVEIAKVNALTLNWTVVHPINERSPLYNLNTDDMKNIGLEILVFVKAFDEAFSNTVMARTSYIAHEIIWGAKFKVMYYPNEDKTKTILDLNMLNDYDKVDLLQPVNPTQPVSG